MDTNEQDQPDMEFEDTFSDHSVRSDSPDSSDTFGESELHPRVGDEYQAAIPSSLTPSERLKYFSNPCDSQPLADAVHNFLIGLPVPVKLAYNGAKTIKDEGTGGHDNINCVKMETTDCVTECSSVSEKKEPRVNGYDFVPGLQGEDAWSEFEVECFLLGLYLFGKNLLQVKEFMEVKEMGQVLSFYYERFYKTAKYQRWADCRKIKGRKCIIGLRTLSGSRQHELLSRLLSHLSEVSRNTAMEAYRALMDGRATVFEYVSTMKSMVGIRSLVEAVRIGKNNGDLTVMAMESSRSNANISSRSETPSSKACSSLTYEEIVKYLTGDFRLSKARSSDLFWEAVWPRLLAKGWHSEKPKDEAYIRRSKNSLVFLLPGIKKFRRKLLKGDHYFDSVSDVLKKVASKPELLVLESEENGATPSMKGNGSGSEPNSEEDGGSDPEHQRYLKPRSSSDAANGMKFTIVDTTLFHEDKKQSMVRELRSLPDEMKTSLSKRQSTANNVPRTAKQNSEHTLKRRRLNACTKAEKKPTARRCSESSLRQPNFVLSLPAHPKKPVHKSQSKKAVPPVNVSSIAAVSHQETHHQSQPLIDLNIPQPPSEPEASVQVTDVKVEEENILAQNQDGSNETDPHLENCEQDEQVNGNGRRHSTRIRPLSTRALEALESSFFNLKVGKKRLQGEDEKPKVSRRARSKTAVKCTGDGIAGPETTRPILTHEAVTVTEPGTMT
ncbi:hypothetical protein V2J09_019634 [Rumex salicifolius]